MICTEIMKRSQKQFPGSFWRDGVRGIEEMEILLTDGQQKAKMQKLWIAAKDSSQIPGNSVLMVNVLKHWKKLLRSFAEFVLLQVGRPGLAEALSTVVAAIQQLWLLTVLWIGVWTVCSLHIPATLHFPLIFVHEKCTNDMYFHNMLDSSKKFWIGLFGHMRTSCMVYSHMEGKQTCLKGMGHTELWWHCPEIRNC